MTDGDWGQGMAAVPPPSSGRSPKTGWPIEMERVPGGLRVRCRKHRLDRTVDSDRHAVNLEAKHLREDHPGVLPWSKIFAKADEAGIRPPKRRG